MFVKRIILIHFMLFHENIKLKLKVYVKKKNSFYNKEFILLTKIIILIHLLFKMMSLIFIC